MNIQIKSICRVSGIAAIALAATLLSACATSQPQPMDSSVASRLDQRPRMGICYQRGMPYSCRVIFDARGGAGRALRGAGYTVHTGH